MSFLDTQSEAWDAAHWEFSLVFEEFEDADLWRRAHPSLLSVGEIICHMVFWQTRYATTLDPNGNFVSPLAREEARYYLRTVGSPLVLDLTVAEVAAEFERSQKAVKAAFLACTQGREEPLSFEGPGRTFGEFGDHMVFHVAYHTGQAFSVRHLMGHKTNDN